MKIHSNQFHSMAWLRVGAALAVGVFAAGCGGGSGGTSRPTPTPGPIANIGEILFVSSEGLTTMNADGSNRAVLPNLEANVSGKEHPKWLPGRQEIIYDERTGSGRGGRSAVAKSKRDGTGRMALAPIFSANATVSPNERRIAYLFRDPNITSSDFSPYVANADGTDAKQLNLKDLVIYFPSFSWSPDGNQLAFTALGNQGRDIYTINVDGSNLRRVTKSSLEVNNVEFSPDGRQFVFSALVTSPRVNSEIFVINVDGSRLRRLTNNPLNDETPVWSPDGRRIAFVVTKNFDDPPSPDFPGSAGQIYVMNVDGSNRINISNNAGRDAGPDWR